MNHELLENISNVQDSALVCASFGVTEEEVDQATRIEEGAAGGKVFYLVHDEETLSDYRVDTLPTSEVTCTCGQDMDCTHRRVAMAAHILYDMERVERGQVESLVRQGYTRESAEGHVYHDAPLVESPEEEPGVSVVYTGIDAKTIAPIAQSRTEMVVTDRTWEAEERKARGKEERAVRRYGKKAYNDNQGFNLMR